MRLLDSKIYDGLNHVISVIQSKSDKIRQNSFFLANIDVFILMFIFITLIISVFAPTEIIGLVSAAVPLLVIIKVLITKGEKIELELCNFCFLIYLIICLISCFTSSMPVQSFYGFMKTVIYFAFYFAMCQFLKDNKHYIIPILLLISVLIFGESIIGLIQNAAGVENISTWQDKSYVNPEDVLSRVYGTLKPYNPNLLGGYLIPGITSAMGLSAIFTSSGKYKSALVSVICSLAAAFTLFITGCRGAYIALGFIIAAIFIFSFRLIFIEQYSKKLRSIWISAASLFAGFSAVFLMLNHGILQRILSIFILRGDSSTSFRMNVYNSSVQMYLDNPIFGIGVGNKVFREIYGLYMLSGFDALSCYCVPLEIAVESGIFALMFFIAFICVLLYSAFKNILKNRNFEYRIILFIASISICAVLIHGLFDTIYFRPQVQFIFWTMAAIIIALAGKEKTVK